MKKGLFQYFKNVKKEAFAGIFFILAETFLETTVPYIYTQIVDVGIVNNDLPYIYLWGGIMVVIAFLGFLTGIISVKFVARVAMGFAANLRQAQFEKVQSLEASKREQFPISSLITRMTNDTYTLQNTLISSMRGTFRAPFMITMVLIYSFSLNAKLAIVFALVLPLVAIVMFVVVFKVRPIYVLMQKRFDNLNKTLQENFTAIRVVKAYVTEKQESNKFIAINNDYRKIASKAFMSVALNNPIMQLGMYATIIGILYVGGNLINTGDAKIGEITGLLTYVMQLLNNLLILAQIAIMFSRSLASITRIKEVLSVENIMEYAINECTINEGKVSFQDVSFHYHENSSDIVSNLNFSFTKGDVVGIIGQTGSGKTTLVSLLARLYDVTSGSILIDDHNIKDLPKQVILDDINLVFQNNVLFSGSILDNLKWGNQEFSDEELQKALKTSLSDEIVNKLNDGLNSEVGQSGQALSGGQKQRIGLARALLKNPKILIIDDALSAIDVINEEKIRQNIKKYYPELTLIIVSQRISAVKKADNILMLHEGHIVDQGSHSYLLAKNSLYQEIFETQKQGARL